ncbi:FtsQ-type POTRA domain-containing protein [Nesterenkonia pannonica]|uniref:cell division protein FtsQ/DivIB n=1 Tax=Nesterenkonia pannonica TaxID=1548602 RepID=UPI00216401A7|nr:FtsQ-type POTRA domain-containing protein [Nesterenkonia pannonica]
MAVVWFSPLLALRHVELEGSGLVSEARVEELLSDLHGKPLPQIGADDVAQRLSQENAVDEVRTRAELPDTLHVEITEHPPVAQVTGDDGVELYSEHGEVIRGADDPEALDDDSYAVPEISSQAALQDERVFESVVQVLGELPESARAELESASAETIDSVTLELSDGRTILWGGADQGPAKAEVLEAVLMSEDEALTEAETIDISTPSTPVTR